MILENVFYPLAFYFLVLLLCVKPLGAYMARVYEGKPCGLDFILSPVERLIYRLCAIHPEKEMGWKKYLFCLLFLNLFGALFVYGIFRLQHFLPLNPQSFNNVSPALAFNTATSFITNTNWQAYGGENTLSYFSQMTALTVQNFLSAATGMAILIAFIRGLIRHETNTLGNAWVDITRSILYILLPLSLALSLALTSQGVIQNFSAYKKINSIEHSQEQIIPMGPAASQIAIKELGSNGGGFFNANSAHPYENPTPISNFLEMLAILLIPAALCYTFGVMVKDKRQGWAILFAMLFIFIPLLSITIWAENHSNPMFTALGIESAGNMEGKETRFGIVDSTLWAAAATATSNGSVNSALDSFTPLGGLIPLWLIHLGEVVFGGVGSGLYGMLLIIIITVFIAGLMVGRTPEYLGKKIEPYEMKMASIAALIMPLVVLLLTALGVVTSAGTSSIQNPGAHGFSEILYAFTSMGGNNGSAFAGLNANTFFYNTLGGIEMLISRFWAAIPILAIAGSLVRKKIIPINAGTLPTHTPLFIILLISVILVLGALTFFPALTLGPIVEQFTFWRTYGY